MSTDERSWRNELREHDESATELSGIGEGTHSALRGEEAGVRPQESGRPPALLRPENPAPARLNPYTGGMRADGGIINTGIVHGGQHVTDITVAKGEAWGVEDD
ncbi:hypothetical protein [Streptomyces sp. JJ38]|uniref:hypothetical protein n=1 Tax=Streptomyces sp. JJ38 TaxID=2738128 RepID=UPI001C55DC62|nr:hypothetical protein [Streptomyces sp. JJ38]MBW1595627.1 hypothetical protein [Streptomyces sp. JJ38]